MTDAQIIRSVTYCSFSYSCTGWSLKFCLATILLVNITRQEDGRQCVADCRPMPPRIALSSWRKGLYKTYWIRKRWIELRMGLGCNLQYIISTDAEFHNDGDGIAIPACHRWSHSLISRVIPESVEKVLAQRPSRKWTVCDWIGFSRHTPTWKSASLSSKASRWNLSGMHRDMLGEDTHTHKLTTWHKPRKTSVSQNRLTEGHVRTSKIDFSTNCQNCTMLRVRIRPTCSSGPMLLLPEGAQE